MNSIMLDEFCNILKAGRTPPERLMPGEVARRFVGHFGFSPFPRMGEMVRVLVSAGIETVPDAKLDKGLRGMHLGTSDGTYVIRYGRLRDGRNPGAHGVPRDLRDHPGAAHRPPSRSSSSSGSASVSPG